MTGCETGTPTDTGMPEDMGMLTDLGMMSDGGTDAGETGTVRPRPAAGLCTASPVDAGAGAATNIALLFGLLTLGLARRLRSRRGQHGVLLASFIVATVLLALTGMSAIASAQPAENREDVARLHFQLGSALYGEGRFAQAAHEFELAYEASQRPQLLHNIYIAYRDAGMLEEALEALRRFVQMAPESETAVYQSRLISLEAQVTELRRLRAGQEATSETTAEVAATSASPPAAPEEPAEGRGGTQRLVGYALLGVGGVGVGTFIGSLVAIGNTSDDLGAYFGSTVGLADNQCQDVPQVDSAESRIGTFRRVAWASLGVGLAAAATSVTLLVLNKSEDDTPTASFACDRTGCVGVVQGRF